MYMVKSTQPRRPRRRKIRPVDAVLISIPAFSLESGLGASYVRKLIADGELPFRVIRGRKWIIRERALAWLTDDSAA